MSHHFLEVLKESILERLTAFLENKEFLSELKSSKCVFLCEGDPRVIKFPLECIERANEVHDHVIKENLSLDSNEMESDCKAVADGSSHINCHLCHIKEELELLDAVEIASISVEQVHNLVNESRFLSLDDHKDFLVLHVLIGVDFKLGLVSSLFFY